MAVFWCPPDYEEPHDRPPKKPAVNLPSEQQIAAKVRLCNRRLRRELQRALADPNAQQEYEKYLRDERPDSRD